VAGLDGLDGSLGPVGPQGPEGPIGPTGATGSPGRDGVDGIDGRDGSAGRDGVDGATGATGLPGATGASGVNTFTIASTNVTLAGITTTSATVTCPAGSVGIAPSWETTYTQARVLTVAPQAGGATWSFRIYNGSGTLDPTVLRLVCVVGSFVG
jgi:hypothetical protein